MNDILYATDDKLRAVVNTNVLVSALISPGGNASAILRKIEENLLIPVYCDEILREYIIVLSRPRFGFPKALLDDALGLFQIYGLMAYPRKSCIYMPDENDRIFYDVAKASGSLLITGNIKHFPHDKDILSPSDFLNNYRKYLDKSKI